MESEYAQAQGVAEAADGKLHEVMENGRAQAQGIAEAPTRPTISQSNDVTGSLGSRIGLDSAKKDLELEDGRQPTNSSDEIIWMIRAVAKALLLFYACYYTIAVSLCAMTGTRVDGFEPFDHSPSAFDPRLLTHLLGVTNATEELPNDDGDLRPLVTSLSMVLAFTLPGPAILHSIARDARSAFVMATQMDAIHVFLTTTVTESFPENPIWWTTAMPCFLFLRCAPKANLDRFVACRKALAIRL